MKKNVNFGTNEIYSIWLESRPCALEELTEVGSQGEEATFLENARLGVKILYRGQ